MAEPLSGAIQFGLGERMIARESDLPPLRPLPLRRRARARGFRGTLARQCRPKVIGQSTWRVRSRAKGSGCTVRSPVSSAAPVVLEFTMRAEAVGFDSLLVQEPLFFHAPTELLASLPQGPG